MNTVSIAKPVEISDSAKKFDLYISGGNVLTMLLDGKCNEFPPDADTCANLNLTIQGLARAARAVVYHAENDDQVDALYAMQPVESIADAIILLSQLSEAARVASCEKQG